MRRLDSKKELAEYSRDAGIFTIKPRAVLVADEERDVLQIVEKASREGLTIIPRGSGTSIPSQSVGRGYVVLQSRREIQVLGTDFFCTPGIVKADLNSTLERSGLWMPVDPSSYKSCSIGGMVANNSSGARTLKYGSTVDYVRDLKVAFPKEGERVVRAMSLEEAVNGEGSTRKVANLVVENWKEILLEKPKTTKNSSGYRLERLIHDDLFDLPKLFVGSEGTLGLISRITCGTRRKPRTRNLMIISIESFDDLGPVVDELRVFGPSALELLDESILFGSGKGELLKQLPGRRRGYLLYAELEGEEEADLTNTFEQIASREKVAQFDPFLLTEDGEINKAWETRNLALNFMSEIRKGKKRFVPGVEDLVVPPDRLPELLAFLQTTFAELGVEFLSYGHAGDANIHVRPLLDLKNVGERRLLREIMRRCFDEVWKMGGSMTGEHGDGRLRAEFVKEQYPRTYDIMIQIKETYDPKWMMNPGVKLRRP